GFFDAEAAEIVTYDPATQRAFVVNGGAKTIDILDISDPAAPSLVGQIDVTQYGGGANSVDFRDGVLVAAVEAAEKTDNGSILFLDSDGALIAQVEAGPLPDMVTFTPDGAKVLTANEGEPNDAYAVDPEGSITIVDISGGVADVTQDDVVTVDFSAFNDADLAPSIRIFGPNATVAQDL
ncbi:MAG: alkaline phosphatase, partial [Planctomycetales bacterium]|nr:alkaline phosphatase [Planctomycetales bacterium]